MIRRLEGRVALVTGAAQGIGAGIAREFAAAGAKLYVSDRNAAGIEKLAGEINATALVQDVAKESEWETVVARLASDEGRLDVLVNNAGIEVVKPMNELSLEEWRRVMSVNLDAIFLGCKSLLPLLSAAGKRGAAASVVNISSIAGIVGFPNQLAYNTSKGGVRHLSKSLAIEWAANGYAIRVNSIHPGIIRTPMLDVAIKDWISTGAISAENPWAAVAALCPLNTIGSVEDIAMGALYLGSNESKFVTGIELVIDGGWIAR